MSLQTMSNNSNIFKLFSKNGYCYRTRQGLSICGDSLDVLSHFPDKSINLVITSPPFALQRKKEYGNKDQDEYISWLLSFAVIVYKKLSDDGSFVIDLGGAYKKGIPIRSLYNFRLLINLCDEIGFHLAEEFFWYNPSKLPSPIEWVNKRKIRVKDSVNTVWWLSKTEHPKADIKNVLVPYSDRMKKLIEDPAKYYSPKERPSGHNIGSNFGNDNGGAIPSNLLQIPNSESNSQYLRRCKEIGIKSHPARFPEKLPAFFIKMLTEPNDLVVDIFAGSNTTGQVAEKLNRKWISIESRIDYISASSFRFIENGMNVAELNNIYKQILSGDTFDLRNFQNQKTFFDNNENGI